MREAVAVRSRKAVIDRIMMGSIVIARHTDDVGFRIAQPVGLVNAWL